MAKRNKHKKKQPVKPEERWGPTIILIAIVVFLMWLLGLLPQIW